MIPVTVVRELTACGGAAVVMAGLTTNSWIQDSRFKIQDSRFKIRDHDRPHNKFLEYCPIRVSGLAG